MSQSPHAAAKQRAEAIGSLMVEYLQAYLANPNFVLTDADHALKICNRLAKSSLKLAEEEYQRVLAEHADGRPRPITTIN